MLWENVKLKVFFSPNATNIGMAGWPEGFRKQTVRYPYPLSVSSARCLDAILQSRKAPLLNLARKGHFRRTANSIHDVSLFSERKLSVWTGGRNADASCPEKIFPDSRKSTLNFFFSTAVFKSFRFFVSELFLSGKTSVPCQRIQLYDFFHNILNAFSRVLIISFVAFYKPLAVPKASINAPQVLGSSRMPGPLCSSLSTIIAACFYLQEIKRFPVLAVKPSFCGMSIEY